MIRNTKFDFFFSYNHDSLSMIQKLTEILKKSTNNTIRIWTDYEQLNRHDNLQLQINNGIIHSKCALCFVTSKYLDSEMGLFQLNASKEIPRIILLLDKFELSKENKTLLDNEFCLDFYENNNNELWSDKNFEYLKELMLPFVMQFYNAKLNNKASSRENIFRLTSYIHQTISTYNRSIEIKKEASDINKNNTTIKNKSSTKPIIDFDTAHKFFNESIKLEPLSANTYNNKGTLSYSYNKFLEALHFYNKATELDPMYSKAYNNKGATFYSLNKLNEAIRCFDKALEIDPSYIEASENKKLTIEKSLKPEETPKTEEKTIANVMNKKK